MKDRRIAPNIYETPHGWRVYLWRQGTPIKKRFKRTEYTLEQVRAFVAAFQREVRTLRQAQRPATVPTETPDVLFPQDAARYLALKTTQAMPSYSDRERDIKRWTQVFVTLPRGLITTPMIDQQLQAWSDEGYAASTVNGWRTALMALCTDLDGPNVVNPVRGSKVFEEPSLTARGISYAYVLKILDAIPDARRYSRKPDAKVRLFKTRPRIGLMASTGMRPSQIGRLERGVHFNVAERWYIIPRSKKGTRKKPRTPRPMTRKHMTEVQAVFFEQFDARDCYVPPNKVRHLKAGMRRAFHVAVAIAEQQIRRERRDVTFRFPPTLKPYDLRHSFASELLRQTKGNYDLVAEHLDQADTRHVRRYGLDAIPELTKQAALAFEAGTQHLPRTEPTPIYTPMPKRRRRQPATRKA